MNLEWFLFLAALLVAVAAALGCGARLTLRSKVIMGAVALLTIASALGWWMKSNERQRQQEDAARLVPRQGRPGGYVSSTECQACHPSQYASWHRSYHRTMTQYASPDSIVADFHPTKFAIGGQVLGLERSGGNFVADVPAEENANPISKSGRSPRVQSRIGMVTGSHHMQVYWLPSGAGNLQSGLPVAWLIEDKRWVPFHSTFLYDPRLPPGPLVWNQFCINCHSVAGQRRGDMQAGTTDTQVAELGIACEACHGPGEEHVKLNRNPVRRQSLHLTGKADPSIVNPRRLESRRSSQVCGQCHAIKLLRNLVDHNENGLRYIPGGDLNQAAIVVRPRDKEPIPLLQETLKEDARYLEDRYWNDGIARVSGRDYNGMIESKCYLRGDMSCISCHSMHESDPVNQLARRMDGNTACLQCHDRFAGDVESHTHHAKGSSGSLCYNCHMPYTTYGLLKAIRSHYIDSPDVNTTLSTGRPNACNLCHLDRTLDWTGTALQRWYGKEKPALAIDDRNISASVLLALRGDAGQRALVAWSMGWKPALEASATSWVVPYLAQLLTDPYSAVRYIANRSLRQNPGVMPFTYDFVGAPAERARSSQRQMEAWRTAHPKVVDREGASVLVNEDGTLQMSTFLRLVSERDDRPVNLQE